MAIPIKDNTRAKASLYSHYDIFSRSADKVAQSNLSKDMESLEFLGQDFNVKCNVVSILDGVTLHYGSFMGDFSCLDYKFDSPKVHFGLLQSGNYKGELDCKPFSVEGGEIYIVAPNTHTIGQSAFADCHCVQIDIDVKESKREIQSFLSNFNIELLYEFLIQNPLVVKSCLHTRGLLNMLCGTKNVDLLRLKVLESLLTIQENAYKSQIHNVYGINYSKNVYIARVAEYLEANYNASEECLNLCALAERFEVCVSKLTSDFRSVKGVSVYQYLKQCKIQNAIFLLQSGKNVSEVANEVGYVNVSCFCKNFREKMGVSPNRFIKTIKNH